jgi:ankyrin repeat protein
MGIYSLNSFSLFFIFSKTDESEEKWNDTQKIFQAVVDGNLSALSAALKEPGSDINLADENVKKMQLSSSLCGFITDFLLLLCF